jgi:ankyrin repeat protein
MSLFSKKKPTPDQISIPPQEQLDKDFFSAVSNGNREKSLQLYTQGANVNYQNSEGNTALNNAAYNGNFMIVQFLVEKLGANTNIRNNAGKRPEDRDSNEGVKAYLRQERQRQKPTGWIKTADDEIAHITSRNTINYRLTEIFNFTARTYAHISQNIETMAESKSLTVFDEFGNKPYLLTALQELKKQGGTPEEASIGGKSHLDKDSFGAGR